MERTETYTDVFENNLGTLSNNSGLLLASDPFKYTMTSPHGVMIIGGLCDFERVAQALDNLSDEIGLTHEVVSGEIPESNENL